MTLMSTVAERIVSKRKSKMKFLITLFFYFTFEVFDASGLPILELDDYNFDSEISEHDLAVVMFYSTKCPYCQKLTPEFTGAKSDMKRENDNVAWIKVDCPGKGKNTCRKFGVSVVPTIKAFRHGYEVAEFDGMRDKYHIVKFVKNTADTYI